jgi:hypothetical protein
MSGSSPTSSLVRFGDREILSLAWLYAPTSTLCRPHLWLTHLRPSSDPSGKANTFSRENSANVGVMTAEEPPPASSSSLHSTLCRYIYPGNISHPAGSRALLRVGSRHAPKTCRMPGLQSSYSSIYQEKTVCARTQSVSIKSARLRPSTKQRLSNCQEGVPIELKPPPGPFKHHPTSVCQAGAACLLGVSVYAAFCTAERPRRRRGSRPCCESCGKGSA